MRLWLRGPTLGAVILFFCSVDVVIMPLLAVIGIQGWPLFLAAFGAASGEILYWYWYAGWLARNLGKSQPAKGTAQEFKRQGFGGQVQDVCGQVRETVNEIRDWFVEHAQNQLAVDTPLKQEMLQGAMGVIRSTHVWMTYPIVIGLGVLPLGWTVAIVILRVHRVPGALTLFLLVNGIKAWALGLAYLWLPSWIKLLVLCIAGIVLLWRIRRWRRRRITSPKDEAH